MTDDGVIDDGNIYLFEDICGDSPFWTPDVLSSEAPKFTACFQTTILQWIPFIWICLALPVYVVVIFRRPPEVRLPLTSFSIAKSVLCVVLVILTIAQSLSVNRNGPGCDNKIVTSTSYYLGYSLTSLSLVIVGVFIQLVRRWGVISSAVIYAYWVLLLLCGIIPLQSTLSYELSCSNSNVVYHIFYFVMIVVQTILHSFADKRSPADSGNEQRCPDVDVSALSNLVYAWMTPTVIKAYKKKIAIYEHWTQSERLKCNNTVSELQLTWNKEMRRLIRIHRQQERTKIETQQNGISKNGHVMGEETPLLTSGSSRKSHNLLEDDESSPQKPSLFRTLFKTYGWLWLQCNLLKAVSDLCLLSQPILIK